MCHWLSAGGHITLVAGVILDHFPGAAGYRLFFVYLFAVTVFGLVLTVIWLRRTKARRAEILEKLKNRPDGPEKGGNNYAKETV